MMYSNARYSVTFKATDGQVRTDEMGILEQVIGYAQSLESNGHSVLEVRNVYTDTYINWER